MSLINDMLKNLEQRQQNSHVDFKNLYSGLAEPEERIDFLRALLVVIILCVFIGAIYLFYKKPWHHPTALEQQQQHIVEHAPINNSFPTSLNLPTKFPATGLPAEVAVPSIVPKTPTPAVAPSLAAPPATAVPLPAGVPIPSAPKVTAVAPTASSPVNLTAGPNLPPPPKVVNDLRLNNQPFETTLSLDLNQAPSYDITTQPTGTILLTLNNTFLERQQICAAFGNPPDCLTGTNLPIPLNGSMLQSIQVLSNDGQLLKLAITPKNGMHLMHHQLNFESGTSLDVVVGSGPALIAPTSAPGVAAPATNQTVSVPVTLGKDGNPTVDSISPINNSDQNAQAHAALSDILNNGPSDSDKMLKPSTNDQFSVNDLRYARITQMIKQGQYTEAEAAIRRLPNDPDNPVAPALLRAEIFVGQNKIDDAVSLLESYRQVPNLPADYYAFLAALYELKHNHIKAMAIYQELIAFWPTDVKWWLGLAISAMHANNNAIAADAFHHVLALSGNGVDPTIASFAEAQLTRMAIEN